MNLRKKRIVIILMIIALIITTGILTVTNISLLSSNSVKAAIPIPPAGVHPRVYLRSTDILALNAKRNDPFLASTWSYIVTQSDANWNTVRTLDDDNSDSMVCIRQKALLPKACALRYLMGDGTAYATKAVSSMDDYLNIYTTRFYPYLGEIMSAAAVVYDWCYSYLTPSQRTDWIAHMRTLASQLECQYPPINPVPGSPDGFLEGNVTGHTQENQVLRDMLACGIAMYDENPEMYNTASNKIINGMVPVRNWQYPQNLHDQGTGYGLYRYCWDVYSQILFNKIGAHDVFSPEQPNALLYYIYGRRPDGQFIRGGDDVKSGQEVYNEYWEYGQAWVTNAYYYNHDNPTIAGLAQKDYQLQMGSAWSEARTYANPFFEFLYYDPNVTPVSRTTLPQSKYFGYPSGEMIARTGWTEGINVNSSDVVANMSFDIMQIGGHQHYDSGAFQLYYKGSLAIDSGRYNLFKESHDLNYQRRTIAHNTMLVYDPNEQFVYRESTQCDFGGATIINDGGQQWPSRGYVAWDLNALLDPAKEYQRGTVTGHQFGPDAVTPNYTYLKADLKAAYSSKVSDYVRSFVFLNLKDSLHPGALIVYDRITSSNPNFQKYWLLHTIEQPTVNGNTTTVVRSPIQPQWEGWRYNPRDNQPFNYNGKMVNTTLLPANPNIVKIGGSGHEFQDLNGTNWAPSNGTFASWEPGAWRIEVRPATGNATDTLLNVMQVMDNVGGPTALTTTKIDSTLMVGAQIADRVVMFSKSGQRLNGPVSFTSTGSGTMQYVITDLAEGNWSVTGAATTSGTVSGEGGVLYYTGPVGSYTLTLTGGPTPTPAPTPVALPYSENFEDSIANGWKVIDGNWSIITDGTKVYSSPVTDAVARTIVDSPVWGNYEASTKVKVNSWGAGDNSAGILARYQDTSNYYLFIFNKTVNELRIVKQVGGTFTTLANKAYTFNTGTWYTFKAVLDGSNFSFYVNGTQELTTTAQPLAIPSS